MPKGMPTGQKPIAHLPRFNHDFNAGRSYTSKIGTIIPVRTIHSVPREHFEIEVSDFLQSMPLATAAFIQGRKEFAFYYVPYVQLWQNYGQYQTGRSDKFSSALKGSQYEPRISLRELFKLCLTNMVYTLACEYSSTNRSKTGSDTKDAILARIPYGSGNDMLTISVHDLSSFDTIPTFKAIVNGVEQNVNPTIAEFVEDRFGLSRWSNWCRKLDMLRYGNILPLLSPVFDEFKKYDQFTEKDSTRTSSDAAAIKTDLIGLVSTALGEINKIPSNYYVQVYPILAYNKLYYTFFRNSYYENDFYVGDYNVDYLDCDSLSNSVVTLGTNTSLQFLDMFQHQWKKDMFTSLMPDTQFGAVSTFKVESVNIEGDGALIGSLGDTRTKVQGEFDISDANLNNRTPGDDYYNQHKVSLGDTNTHDVLVKQRTADGTFGDIRTEQSRYLSHYHSLVNGDVRSIAGSAISLGLTSVGDVLALKRAEAIQKYRQTLIRCGNKTKDIMMGLYGSEPAWENDHDPAFIDAFGYDFSVDRVLETATTNPDLSTYDGKLGDVGGQIARLGSTKRKISYTTRGDFGLVMCLSYQVVESEYNSYNIDANLLALTPEDHYIPDYQDLGFVPVTRRLLSLLDPVHNRVGDTPDLDAVLGYGTRYFEKKIDISTVHGILCSFGQYEAEHGSSINERYHYFGDFSHWVAPRTDMQSALVTTTKQFYIDPRILNGNFLLAADGRQETDQFINRTYFKVNRTNTISDLGLPKF